MGNITSCDILLCKHAYRHVHCGRSGVKGKKFNCIYILKCSCTFFIHLEKELLVNF